jgi:hypothetical protein
MSFEPKLASHPPVAVSQVLVCGFVAAGAGNLRAHPQKPEVVEHEPELARHAGQRLNGCVGILDVSIRAAAQQQPNQYGRGWYAAHDCAVRDQSLGGRSGQIDGTVDVTEPGLFPRDVDLGD